MKAYIISATDEGTEDIDGIYTLVTETGVPLASHLCSNRSFAEGDLYFNRPERVTEFTERFGEMQILHMGADDMTNEKLLTIYHKAQELNEVAEEVTE
jgi:hypothetical protein